MSRDRPDPRRADARFREIAFRVLPLACLAAAALAGAVAGPAWSIRLSPIPWIVSLAFVGLPHGATDFAVSRRAWRGWPLAALWIAYAGIMAAVAAGFAAFPVPMLAIFAGLSCWHFGLAHLDAEGPPAGRASRVVGAIARGGVVLAVPLAAWPVETARAAAELLALTVRQGPAPVALLSPDAIRAAGFVATGLTAVAVSLERLLLGRRPGARAVSGRLVVDLVVIGSLGFFTDPLFSVGLYFLAWHGWRQMEPLAEAVTGATPGSWAELAAALLRIHAAALPLLLPAWAMLGAAWWRWSAGHGPRDLAILSIGAYLVVTPAHELLGDLLRAVAARRAAGGDAAVPPRGSRSGRPRSCSA